MTSTHCLQTFNDSIGWQARIELGFEHSGLRSILKKSKHYGPLRVQRPFYPEGELAHIYILHPPGGVVGGDQLHIELKLDNNAQVLCTTPGSGKFYLSRGDWAVFEQYMHISACCSLEWFPQENILFAGSRLRSRCRIEVEDNAKFIGFDITCLGRPTSQERFDSGAFDARLEFYHNKRLLLVENLRVLGEENLDSATGLRGNAVQAIMLAFPCTDRHLELVRKQLNECSLTNLIAVTLFDGLLVVRALGGDAQIVKQLLISIWQILRPALLGRSAILPRIWAT